MEFKLEREIGDYTFQEAADQNLLEVIDGLKNSVYGSLSPQIKAKVGDIYDCSYTSKRAEEEFEGTLFFNSREGCELASIQFSIKRNNNLEFTFEKTAEEITKKIAEKVARRQ